MDARQLKGLAVALPLFLLGMAITFVKPEDWKRLIPSVVVQPSVEGAHLIVVRERTTGEVDHSIALRSVNEFVERNKMTGFLDIDDEDDYASQLISEVKSVYKIDPPFLAAAIKEASEKYKVVKAVPFKESLEELVK